MTIRFYFFSALFIGLFFTSCKQDPSTTPLIERNSEVKEYFEKLDELVGEYCTMIEKMVDHAEKIEAKEDKGEETSFLDGFAMLGDMAGSMIKITRLASEIEEMEERHEHFEDDLTAVDFEEFLKIYSKMIQRFYDIAKKAESLDK